MSASGLEEGLAARKMRQIGGRLEERLRVDLEEGIGKNLSILSGQVAQEPIDPEAAQRAIRRILTAVERINESIRGFLTYQLVEIDFNLSHGEITLLRDVISHEMRTPLHHLFGLADRYKIRDGTVSLENLSADLNKMKEAFARLQAVLEELRSLQYLRPIFWSGHDMFALAAFGPSQQPSWKGIEGLRTSSLSYAPVDPANRDRILRVAQSGDRKARSFALIPLAPGETIVIHPYYLNGFPSLAQAKEHLGEANRRNLVPGVEFADPAPFPMEWPTKTGFFILGPDQFPRFPSGLELYPRFWVDQILRYHPALIAAMTLHPRLPAEFLKGLEGADVKPILIEEKVGEIQHRYLVLLRFD